MRLDDLLHVLATRLPEPPSITPLHSELYAGLKDTAITQVTADSRKVAPGSLFVALPGSKADGHQFIERAISSGASVIVVSESKVSSLSALVKDNHSIAILKTSNTNRAFAGLVSAFMGMPAEKLTMIGVTGTNGKTTVTHLIERLLEDAGHSVGLIGTLGVRALKGCNPDRVVHENAEATYDATGNTTPMADELQQILSSFAQQAYQAIPLGSDSQTQSTPAGISHVVMEVSSHALDQSRVYGCDFKLALITNLTQDHLDYHKSMDAYCSAKERLFRALKNQPDRAAVINLDDPWAYRFLAATPAHVSRWTYGLKSSEANVRATDVDYKINGTTFHLITPVGECRVSSKLGGRFGVYNTLAAIAAGLALNIPLECCVRSIEAVEGVRGRFEVVSQHPFVIVDYAHTPDGLQNVLEAARAVMKPQASSPDQKSLGRLIAVFGCGGDRDATKRPKMGRIAEQLADIQVVTSDNPRSEDPQQILTDILSGIEHLDPKRTYVQPDRRTAIRLAINLATHPNDVVVIAGKGHEDYQILPTGTIHFDDREEVQTYVAESVAV
ncbi:MAG: UDP-N-acetylmuramoyl-L-alanyl-D-glutamate--2,6-diaminopimelate ligase [Vampirovibrionales bacterium]|nr:UDP-N-acetylmuramoyl-L-alanyl-D-glutamate--2,6-diaminopimelate ligase [Vampirovibrionales bacterium]